MAANAREAKKNGLKSTTFMTPCFRLLGWRENASHGDHAILVRVVLSLLSSSLVLIK